NKTSLVLYRGTSNVSETLTATVIPSDASNTAVTWTSSNTSVATVSSSGVVIGEAKGTATITVTANDGSGALVTCEVEVKQWVTDISLDKTLLSLVIGDIATLSVTSILPDNANDKTYSWSSSDSVIASVDNSGKVTAKAKGKATIKATANDGSGVNATCSVVVSSKCPAGAVDMGITTADGYKLYWGTSNLGAGKPEEYGDYYAWGEIDPYYSSQSPLTWKNGKSKGYVWASYKWCNGSERTLTKYNTNSSYGTVDNKTVLESSDDVAIVNLGGKWRMPTDAEWTKLRTKCTWTWTDNYNGTGVSGRIVTATNGNSIFLPAAGERYNTNLRNAGSYGLYWSSSLNTGTPSYAWYVYFWNDDVDRDYYGRRCNGQSVRPVTE
ncbi:MAG: Ig-like domain-containing protein, partial [Bacteroidales bacterium]|nr:Ig-like domain-containing protein [Bacteroidales bacterium]